MSTSTPDTGTTTDTSTVPDAPVLPDWYTVNRTQDGEQVRAELDLDTAMSEANILNAQARQSIGQTVDGIALYGSMINGEVSRFEVRSASGLVVS